MRTINISGYKLSELETKNAITDGIYSAIKKCLKKWIETYCGKIDEADTKKNQKLLEMCEYVNKEVKEILDKLLKRVGDKKE